MVLREQERKTVLKDLNIVRARLLPARVELSFLILATKYTTPLPLRMAHNQLYQSGAGLSADYDASDHQAFSINTVFH